MNTDQSDESPSPADRDRKMIADARRQVEELIARQATRQAAGASRRSAPPPLTDSIEGYDILSEIHRGGQGVVYKAIQKATKRTVALKVLLHGPYASRRQRYRFEREIDLVASLQHPNIIGIFHSVQTSDDRDALDDLSRLLRLPPATHPTTFLLP